MAGSKVPQVRRLMYNDERIGMGFSSGSGLAVGTPFVNDDIVVEEDPNAPGQEVFSTIVIINTHEELMKSIGMSLDAQGRYGFFSGALKAQFTESTSYNSTSTFLSAKVIVQNPFTRGREFNLSEVANGLLEPPAQEEVFTRAFGDGFVRGLQTGGEFYAVIRLTSASTTKQDELAVTLQAAYNGLATAAEFEATFRQANLSASTRSEFSGMMYQRAGSGEEISVVTEVSDILARVRNFPTIVEAEPVAYEVEVATYDTLPLPLPTPEEQEDFLIALHDAREKKLRYLQAKNDLEFARLHAEFFEDLPADDVLLQAIVTYTQLLNAVMNHGIELSQGRMRPPRVFDPNALAPPIVEPLPMHFKRKRLGEPTIMVPQLLSIDDKTLVRALNCLQNGDVESCIGQAFVALGENFTPGGALPDPIIFEEANRELFTFLKLVSSGAARLTMVPPVPGNGDFVVTAQRPDGGALISADEEVIVEFGPASG
jgi:hypothetical protein